MGDASSAGEAAKKIDFCDSWYDHDIKNIPESTRQLFENYSGIPPEQVLDHIQHMRARAFAIYPYPCIGQLRFLNLSLSNHPLYPEVVSRLRHYDLMNTAALELPSLSMDGQNSGIFYQHQRPQIFLDLGCCLAQDLRKLVYDGASSENLYGLDVEGRFIELSYELFCDADTLKSRFVVDDLLRTDAEEVDPSGPQSATHELSTSSPHLVSLASLDGKVSIIAANSFLHLYDYSDQLRLAKRMARLLSPERGSLILGRQVGSSVPGEYNAVDNKGTRFSHNIASFHRLWDQVAEEVGHGCKFRVEATLDEEELGENKNQGQNWSEPNIKRLRFGVWRE